MSNIICFHTRQPITQNNEPASKYFRVTSASKPTASARSKRLHILARGWKEFTGHDFVCYFSPYTDEPYYLEDAFEVECVKAREA